MQTDLARQPRQQRKTNDMHSNIIEPTNHMAIKGLRAPHTALSYSVQRFLERHPDLRYEENIFSAACNNISQSTEAEPWSRDLTCISKPEDMLERMPSEMHLAFLEAYARFFNRMLTI